MSGSSWRPNPYAKKISASGRRLLTLKALAAELGSELAILSPDVAEAFPTSNAVNEALRALLAAAETVRTRKTVRKVSSPKKRSRAA